MKKLFLFLFLFLSIAGFSPLSAKLNVAVSYPYIEDLVKKIGGTRVSVSSLASGSWDPHYVVPRPSLIAKLRQVDLVISNGAELEAGWLPVLLRDSNNNRIQPGSDGYLELASSVDLIQKPNLLSRALGDVHPHGNPHISLDPSYVPRLAESIAERLSRLDPPGKDEYKKRLADFNSHWNSRMKDWEMKMAPFRGSSVVEYHRVFDYFLNHYGIKADMTIEPLPGIPPSAGHTKKVIDEIKKNKIRFILMDVYHSRTPADYIAEKTGAKVILIPHDVNAIKDAVSMETVFDEIVRRFSSD